MDKREFLRVFSEALEPDTKRVKAATETLKSDYYPLPESLTTLLQLLLSDQDLPLRQLAATQSRSLIPKHWKTFSPGDKKDLRGRLLQGTLHEEEQVVRHAAARVITAIAKIDIENKEWPEFLDQLLSAAGSRTVREREVGTYLLYTCLESIGEAMKGRKGDVLEVLGKTIGDPESAEVRINTMLALSSLACELDPDDDAEAVQAVGAAIPQMSAILKQCIDNGDEDRVAQSFEVFQTLLGCDAAILNKHFGDLVQFMIKIAAEKSLDDDARTQALSFLMQCVRYRKLKLQALKVGEQITLMCLEISTEFGEAAINDDDDDVSTARSALILLDEMSSSLPPAQVVVPLLHNLGPYVSSQDADRRQGGLLALGMVVEGAPDFISTQLHEIFPLLLRLLEDNELRVRRAALDGIMRVAEDMPEELAKEHQKLIPALVKHIDAAVSKLKAEGDKSNTAIVKATCNCIEAVVDGMEEKDIKPYLSELVPRLHRLFSHPDLKLKGAAVGAIGGVGAAGKEDFLPFFPDTMTALQEYVELKDSPDELDLRSITVDAIGSLASAVGAKPFQRYVQPLMQVTDEGLHLEHPKLKETSYLFWAMMSKVYKEEFKPFIPGVVKALFECLENEESDLELDLGEEASDLAGKEVVIGGKKIKISALADDDFIDAEAIEDLDDAAEGSDDDDWDDVDVISAIAQEKEIAIEVIGDILTHSTRDYLEYLEKTIELILPMTEHSFEGVQKAAISTLFRAYAAVWELQPESVTKWEPGIPVKNEPSAQVKKLGEVIIGATLLLWKDEEDRAIVTETNRSLAATLKASGPSLVSSPQTLKTTTQILHSIISKTHPCQKDFGLDEDFGALEEISEYDWLTIDTAMDALAGLAMALGPAFAELWPHVSKPILAYASGSENFERATAVGVISECIRGMEEGCTPFTPVLLPLLLKRLGDEDPEVKSNAAFAVGLLQEHSEDESVVGKFPEILSKLEGLLGMGEARARDNAAGCLGRMISANGEHLPVGEIVGGLLEVLPLREDYDENEPVWDAVVGLYSQGNPPLVQQTPRLLAILAEIFSSDDVDEQLKPETKAKVGQMLKFIKGKFPGEVGKYEVFGGV